MAKRPRNARRWWTRVIVAACVALAFAAPSRTALASHVSPKTRCARKLRAVRGDTFSDLARRCYGSRTYERWLTEHNHRPTERLRVGETIDVPPFASLIREQLPRKWRGDVATIATAFTRFLDVQPEIEAQLRRARPGMATYRPSAHAKAQLERAAAALRPLVKRLRERGVRTRKFEQAADQLGALARGGGELSTDYAVEELHQCFSYGVDALSGAR